MRTKAGIQHAIAILSVLLGCFNLAGASIMEDLLPRPQELAVREGTFAFAPEAVKYILMSPDKKAGNRLVRHLNRAVFRGEPLRSVRVSGYSAESGYVLLIGQNPRQLSLPEWAPAQSREEAYQLRITTNGIVVGASTERGIFYGLQTLGQLMVRKHVRGETNLPCLEIRDWPGLAMRGYSEDYGRNQLPTLEDHKRMIRFLARHKMNTYLWFIEPDHFIYNFDSSIGQEFDRFRFQEIRQLVAFAKDYHVEVIPTVELLGHMEGVLSHPTYRKLAEVEGMPDLCASCDDSFALVSQLVGEIAPAFESKYFHCGLDESFQIGKGRSAQAVKEKGLERVMADYYIRMNDLVRSHGKTMVMYADIVLAHPGIIDLLPKNIVMMFWDYVPQEKYPLLEKLHRAGFEVTTLSGLWDWAHIYPAYSFSFRNISALTQQSHQLKVKGSFVSSWGDPVSGAAGMNLSELNTFGVAYAGAQAWKAESLSLPDFSRAFTLSHFGSADPAVSETLTRLAEVQGDRITLVRRFFEENPAVAIKSLAESDRAYWEKIKAVSQQSVVALQTMTNVTNLDQLQSILLSAQMLELAADKALALRLVRASMKESGSDKEKPAQALEGLATRLQGLGKQYQTIYLATNRPINAKYIERDWNRMVLQLRELAAGVRSGSFKL